MLLQHIQYHIHDRQNVMEPDNNFKYNITNQLPIQQLIYYQHDDDEIFYFDPMM
jgi:hypothetical protein